MAVCAEMAVFITGLNLAWSREFYKIIVVIDLLANYGLSKNLFNKLRGC